MDKRYQVFLSSTYNDLKEERQEVISALIRRKCFPIAMEYFPAMSRKSIDYIKDAISECDFYILIVARRYGSSLDENGISLTEIEFDYAQKLGIPTNIYLYDGPPLPSDKIEDTDEGKKRLANFINKLKKTEFGYDTWTNKDNLASVVKDGIEELKKSAKAVGWIRGDALEKTSSEDDTLEKEKMLCLGIADKILTDIDYDDWYFWTSWLTSADGPSLALDRERALENMITYINKSAIWPNSFPRVKAAFENFAAVAKDLLKQFFKHAEIRSATSDRYTTKKFYKIPEDNPNYEEDAARYDKHVDIIHAYTFELTKAINYVCDIIRKDVDKTYRAVDGKRYITRGYEQGGFYNYFPEYSDKDLKDCKPPYPGAEAFLRRLGIS